jgi:membrane protein DedA with SNARE-associated domain/membrane-associated phospholipid phosphatase
MAQTLTDLVVQHIGLAYAIVFAASLGEALFVVGLFVPSTVVLIAAGALVGSGKLDFLPVMVLASAAAAVGDAMSFWIGHHYREGIRLVWPFSRYTTLLDRGERFFTRHGGKSILLGRFVPGIKAIVPGIAGMAGMNFAWFTFVNVTSAILWAAAHIVPAAGIGRGLSSVNGVDPRLVLIAGAALLLVLGTFYGVRLSVRLLGPPIGRWRRSGIDALSARSGWLTGAMARLLSNERNVVGRWLVVLVAAFAGAAFLTLLVNLLFDPELQIADQSVFNYLQSFRSGTGTSVVTAVTMAADGLVLTALTLALVGWLSFRRHFRLAIAAAVAIGTSALFVPTVKSIIQRPRPTDLYAGAEAFSFPSGHATLSTTVFGVLAVLLACNMPARFRPTVIAVAAVAAVTVAFSRLYLGAHWLSDVAAGLSFGTLVTAVFAFFVSRADRNVRALPMAVVLLATFAASYGYDLTRNYDRWVTAYAPTAVEVTLSHSQWLDGGWRRLPSRRLTIGGDEAGRLPIQTDLDLGPLTERLGRMGWSSVEVGKLIDAALPSSRPLIERPASAVLHDGRRPLAAYVRYPGTPDLRDVLTFWPAARLSGPMAGREILVGGLSRETIDPLLGTYGTLDVTEFAGRTDSTAPRPDGAIGGSTVLSPTTTTLWSVGGLDRTVVP